MKPWLTSIAFVFASGLASHEVLADPMPKGSQAYNMRAIGYSDLDGPAT